jgi:hypothetical protein
MRSRRGSVFAILLLCVLVVPIVAQQRVSPGHQHERIRCVVPMVGSGTYDDPRRPAFVSPQADHSAESLNPSDESNGKAHLLSYSYLLSDDGQFALVEFVALDKSAFNDIKAQAVRQGFRVFEDGKQRNSEILREFRKYKKDYDFNLQEAR